MANLSSVLSEIVRARDLKAGQGRALPLVVINAVGVGGGGFDGDRGLVIDRMLEVCQTVVNGHALDIAITCLQASDYAALQHQRRASNPFGTLSDAQKKHGDRLAELASQGELALFLGAGVSVPAGLPSWWDLLAALGEECGVTEAKMNQLDSPLDQAELIRRRLPGGRLKKAVGRLLENVTVPSLSHVQLAALGCREVVTTNYDSLYEQAANAFADRDGRVKVLPFEQKKPFQKWILKMHGDLEHPGEIILSRSDFVGYSAIYGPVGSIVQSLMLTKHLLVVGTSLTDDNFLRLAYEVSNYLRSGLGTREPEPFGTVLSLADDAVKKELWDGTFEVVGAATQPTPDYEGLSVGVAKARKNETLDRQARDLSIMLDYIAMKAASDSYLLDERYRALLNDEEKLAASAFRAALGKLPRSRASGSGWSRLAGVLRELGAG